jgi:hypothetical protein
MLNELLATQKCISSIFKDHVLVQTCIPTSPASGRSVANSARKWQDGKKHKDNYMMTGLSSS